MENPNDPKGSGNPVVEEEVEHPGGTPGAKPVEEERLYAGRFKTPEELEVGYKNSSTEGQRLAQEVKRLQVELQQARTPEKKEVIQDKIDDLTKHFDPETARILSTWTKQQIQDAITKDRESFTRDSAFQSQVSSVWEETKKVFPDVANPQSKLFVRANELLFERNLAEWVEVNGEKTLRLLTPFAYRMATEAAYAELGMKASENAPTQVKKGQAGMVQGRGSKSFGGGKLTYEQYMALPDEQRDEYDKQQTGR